MSELAAWSVAGGGLAALPDGFRWVAFYGWSTPEEELAAYDLVVLDPGFSGDIARVAAGGAIVCGYLSLGEVRVADPLFATLDPALLLEENPAWPGTRQVDVRHPAWIRTVLDVSVPALVRMGFVGLLLDTLDTPPFLEATDSDRFAGMRAAAVGLVAAVREAYPSLALAINRGYAVLGDLVGHVDAVLAESLLTSPGADGVSRLNTSEEVGEQLALLAPLVGSRVPVLGLEYWDPSDTAGVRALYAAHRRLGHAPYVATRLLDRVMPEPVA